MHVQRTFVALAGLVLSASALAHHGWSGNNTALELSGTVVSVVDLSGPHATMQIEDANGQVWNVTLAPAPRTARAGLREDTLAVGDQVTLSGSRNDDDSRFEIKTRRVQRGNEIFDVYPPE